MMLSSAYVLALFLGLASATPWSNCGSVLSTIDKVEISGCDDAANECILKRNTNVSINVDFTSMSSVDKINTVVHGIMMGMPVPFPVPNPNACQDTGLSCPLKPSEKYSYKAIMPILKSYPKVTVDVKWELQNPSNTDIICLLIKAKIN